MKTNGWVGLTWALLMFIFCSVSFEVIAQTNRFEYRKFTDSKGNTLDYRLLSPDYDTMRKYPLVIFLHGSGERGNDNESQLKWGAMNFAGDMVMSRFPAFVAAPQCPANQTWSSFENKPDGSVTLTGGPTEPFSLMIGLVRSLISTLAVDPDRVYITGLSMGGYGTFEAIERYPDLFAAALPIAGGGDVTMAKSIAHIPIWIIHGAEDPGVNPMLSMSMADALQKAGAHPGLTIYPETGHFAWLAAYSDPLILEWLFRQEKE